VFEWGLQMSDLFSGSAIRDLQRIEDKRVSVSKIHINRQGYDSRGRYYGIGKPVFQVDAPDIMPIYVRADSRGMVTLALKMLGLKVVA
jgi:hypothetical protein